MIYITLVFCGSQFLRTLTLLLPYIVSAINEKMMYIFAVVNVLSIPIGMYQSLKRRSFYMLMNNSLCPVS